MSEIVAEVETAAEMQGLVNRLAREMSQIQRTMSATQQKLANMTRSLEVRTQELTEARAALALLLATLDASQDGILAMGYFGRAMHFNTRFIELWGISQEKAAQLNDSALLALQLTQVRDPQRFLEISNLRRARADEERRDMIELTDGRILERRLLPQRVRGRRVGTVTCFRDVTDQERLDRLVTLLETEVPERVAEARATIY